LPSTPSWNRHRAWVARNDGRRGGGIVDAGMPPGNLGGPRLPREQPEMRRAGDPSPTHRSTRASGADRRSCGAAPARDPSLRGGAGRRRRRNRTQARSARCTGAAGVTVRAAALFVVHAARVDAAKPVTSCDLARTAQRRRRHAPSGRRDGTR
jgi:hypothetical protein